MAAPCWQSITMVIDFQDVMLLVTIFSGLFIWLLFKVIVVCTAIVLTPSEYD